MGRTHLPKPCVIFKYTHSFIHFLHAPLGLHSAKGRCQSPDEWMDGKISIQWHFEYCTVLKLWPDA